MAAKSPKPYTEAQVRRGDAVIKRMSKLTTALYRRTNGRIGGRFLRGAPVCLLTTIGRVSGEARTTPLLYLADGDDIVLVASKGGFPGNPNWYLNLKADPEVTIQIGSVAGDYTAAQVSPQDKAELWPRLVAMYQDFETYQARTDRDIPVIRCRRRP
ncbi:MAG: nitroreductase family deazaflavin-dependent oxidoreductase [Microthrixaceae bacterium]|nr:nitroreductase family deazaflavin-dependent oxidoreductase [Microthrixaceae bacterium]